MKFLKYVFNRVTLMVIAVVIELFLVIQITKWFGNVAGWMEGFFRFMAVIIVLFIIRNSRHLSSDMMWIVLIMIAPLLGAGLYLFLAGDMFISRTFRALVRSTNENAKYYHQDPDILKTMEETYP